jgi:hypothetical protein
MLRADATSFIGVCATALIVLCLDAGTASGAPTFGQPQLLTLPNFFLTASTVSYGSLASANDDQGFYLAATQSSRKRVVYVNISDGSFVGVFGNYTTTSTCSSTKPPPGDLPSDSVLMSSGGGTLASVGPKQVLVSMVIPTNNVYWSGAASTAATSWSASRIAGVACAFSSAGSAAFYANVTSNTYSTYQIRKVMFPTITRIVYSATGDIYIATNSAVYVVPYATGTLTHYYGDVNGFATAPPPNVTNRTAATSSNIYGLAILANTYLLVADGDSSAVRQVDLSTGTVTNALWAPVLQMVPSPDCDLAGPDGCDADNTAVTPGDIATFGADAFLVATKIYPALLLVNITTRRVYLAAGIPPRDFGTPLAAQYNYTYSVISSIAIVNDIIVCSAGSKIFTVKLDLSLKTPVAPVTAPYCDVNTACNGHGTAAYGIPAVGCQCDCKQWWSGSACAVLAPAKAITMFPTPQPVIVPQLLEPLDPYDTQRYRGLTSDHDQGVYFVVRNAAHQQVVHMDIITGIVTSSLGNATTQEQGCNEFEPDYTPQRPADSAILTRPIALAAINKEQVLATMGMPATNLQWANAFTPFSAWPWSSSRLMGTPCNTTQMSETDFVAVLASGAYGRDAGNLRNVTLPPMTRVVYSQSTGDVYASFHRTVAKLSFATGALTHFYGNETARGTLEPPPPLPTSTTRLLANSDYINGLALLGDQALLISDGWNQAVRRVDLATGIVTNVLWAPSETRWPPTGNCLLNVQGCDAANVSLPPGNIAPFGGDGFFVLSTLTPTVIFVNVTTGRAYLAAGVAPLAWVEWTPEAIVYNLGWITSIAVVSDTLVLTTTNGLFTIALNGSWRVPVPTTVASVCDLATDCSGNALAVTGIPASGCECICKEWYSGPNCGYLPPSQNITLFAAPQLIPVPKILANSSVYDLQKYRALSSDGDAGIFFVVMNARYKQVVHMDLPTVVITPALGNASARYQECAPGDPTQSVALRSADSVVMTSPIALAGVNSFQVLATMGVPATHVLWSGQQTSWNAPSQAWDALRTIGTFCNYTVTTTAELTAELDNGNYRRGNDRLPFVNLAPMQKIVYSRSTGDIYIATSTTISLLSYATGKLENAYSIAGSISGMALLADKYLLISDQQTFAVRKIDLATGIMTDALSALDPANWPLAGDCLLDADGCDATNTTVPPQDIASFGDDGFFVASYMTPTVVFVNTTTKRAYLAAGVTPNAWTFWLPEAIRYKMGFIISIAVANDTLVLSTSTALYGVPLNMSWLTKSARPARAGLRHFHRLYQPRHGSIRNARLGLHLCLSTVLVRTTLHRPRAV